MTGSYSIAAMQAEPTRGRRTTALARLVGVGAVMALAACARPGLAMRVPDALAPAAVAMPADVPVPTSRSFRMGFTTEPGGPSGGPPNTRARTLKFVQQNADLITLHRDGPPVPWQALATDRLDGFRNQLARLRARYGTVLPVYVLITPLNVFRNGIGGNFPASLGPACMSNPQLRHAFENYARVVVEAMHPDYLGLGAEVNLYRPPADCPGDADAFVSLYKETYALVKAMAPETPVFVTFQLDFLHGANDPMFPARFLPELDRLALSLYPSGNLTQLQPSQLPPDYISWARVAAPDLPLVIAETGYGSHGLAGFIGSPELQTEYLQWLFAQAQDQHAEFVNWFFSTDPRFVHAPPGINFINAFRFIGLVTPRFRPKPAFAIWQQYLQLPYEP